MTVRRTAARLIAGTLASLALVVGTVTGRDEASAAPIAITSVQPYLGVTYVTSWNGATPNTRTFQFKLANSGMTDATSVTLGESYQYQLPVCLLNGPHPCFEIGGSAAVIDRVPAGGFTLVSVVCHTSFGVCKAGHVVILSGNYLVDPQHAVADAP